MVKVLRGRNKYIDLNCLSKSFTKALLNMAVILRIKATAWLKNEGQYSC